MVGEIVEIYLSQMAKSTLKLFIIVEIYLSQKAKNTLKLSTMVGENFENYWSQIAKKDT